MAYAKAKKIYADTISQIRADGLYKEERVICSPQSGQIRVRFPADAPEKEIINLCANNYLGLSSHPDVIRAAHEGLDQRGYGMSSVRFICGTQDIHRELETRLSRFLGMEDAVLFSSCFDANGAVFEALLTAEDGIFSDKLVHASLIDGIRLSKAQRFVFEHSDMNDLENKLGSATCRLKLIVTDGVFSMDGDMAKMDQLAALAQKYDALLMTDESHASGFIGRTGRGVHEHFGVMDKIDIITTTFGKALGGAAGGAVCARREIVELLKQRGRPYLFSNSLPPPVVAATIRVLEILSQTTERRDKLERHTVFWRKALATAGFELKPGNTPIVPVMLYDAKVAQQMSRDLYDEGVFAVGFFFPVVAKGQARIRTQLSAALEQEHLDHALKAFIKIGRKHGVIR
ncbi:MAG: glycine C-acetyltransferase [Bdellovibrionales bacterium RIFOXYD1_FULL_53_11]|nr:MAG: glycine C-acetyltransferase [Bdellovibrionales bacterium RIFOXYD1_FULL_53_11]